MKIKKIATLLSFVMACISGFSQVEPEVIPANYGNDKMAIFNYFEPFFKEELQLTSFKRSVFKIGIDEQGNIVKVAAINHPLSSANEEKIINKIYAMKWNPKLNPDPVSCVLHLVLTVDADGNLTVEIK